MLMFRRATAPAALCLLAASALTTHAAVAQNVVNGELGSPTLSQFIYFPTATIAPGGAFWFTANFCNSGSSELYDLQSMTVTLSNGNFLYGLPRNILGGVGSLVPFSDQQLSPGECVDVPYYIGLQTPDPFAFYVDIVTGFVDLAAGDAPAQVCAGAGTIDIIDRGGATGFVLYEVRTTGDVRVTGTDPAPIGYESTERFPIGCGEPHPVVFPRYATPVPSSIRVLYECDCPTP